MPTLQIITLKRLPVNDLSQNFQAPGATDVRDTCQTLNALVNLCYNISCDNTTSFAEAANALQIGYGFDYNLSVYFSTLGLMAGGDLITEKYTIGGADARVPNIIGPPGSLDQHGVFEIAGSITCEDVHFRNNATFFFKDGMNTSTRPPKPEYCSDGN